jgi:hypothetical protein
MVMSTKVGVIRTGSGCRYTEEWSFKIGLSKAVNSPLNPPAKCSPHMRSICEYLMLMLC